MVARSVVTFCSDFGLDDPFVGLCHAAVAAEAPEARVIDLGHAIRPQHVRQGAARLADAAVWTPSARGPGSVVVHLAVVDPGVGTDRRGVVVAAGDRCLVGPDNGLLAEAAERLGGAAAAWELDVPRAAAATFHGRDVFAPAAGRLAAGAAPGSLGPPVEPARLVRLPAPELDVRAGEITVTVRDVDRYGNVQLAAPAAALEQARLGGRVRVVAGARACDANRVRTYGDLADGDAGVLVDSFGWVAVVIAGGSANHALTVDLGAVLRLEPA